MSADLGVSFVELLAILSDDLPLCFGKKKNPILSVGSFRSASKVSICLSYFFNDLVKCKMFPNLKK